VARAVSTSSAAKKLGAGQKATFKLGTGKVGATHWEGMITATVGGEVWKRPVTFDTVLTRTLQIGYDKNYVSRRSSSWPIRRSLSVALLAKEPDPALGQW
jgi:hypothetical protein